MASYTTLKYGSKGSEVKTLQEALIKAGYSVGSSGADGILGKGTESAIKKYQKDKGLTVDGIAGKNTLGSLYTTKTTNTNKSNKTNNDTKEATNPTFKGVDQKYVDIAYQDYTPSEKETEYLDSRNKYGQMYEDKVEFDKAKIVPQTIYAFNQTAIVPFLHELFSSIALRLRYFSPFENTLCVSNANDSHGYLPAKEDIARGGYEVAGFLYLNAYKLSDDTDTNIIKENLRIMREGLGL